MFNDNSSDDDDGYFATASFFARFILLLMLLGAWVSAAVALDSTSLSASALSSTRTAFLIIAVLAFVEALTIMILSLVDIINEVVYLILDIIFALMLLAVSIAAIVRDNQVNNKTIDNSQYRYGSLAAAAVFGFISFILYVLLVIFYIVGID